MASRYQQRTLYAEQEGVRTYEGLDPLTGLPVLIYRFAGRPVRALSQLESENIPGVLDIASDQDETQVVVAYSKDYRPLMRPLHVPTTVLLLDSARALRDAAQVGVVHGDLRPVRFLASRDHVLVEGFGIPWANEKSAFRAPEGETSFAADVYAWAKSMRDLVGDMLSSGVSEVLERCLARDPEVRPDAAELYESLSEAIARSTNPTLLLDQDQPSGEVQSEADVGQTPGVSPGAAKLPVPGFRDAPSLSDLELSLEEHEASRPAASPRTGENANAPADVLGSWSSDDQAQDDPMLIVSDPGLTPPEPKSKGSAPSASFAPYRRTPVGNAGRAVVGDEEEGPFVKTLPPGATYRSGEEQARPYLRPGSFEEYTFGDEPNTARRRRRFIMLALLFVAAAALLALGFWQQRERLMNFGGGDAPAISHVVNVAVEPGDLPPVRLYVVSSPDGSQFQPGDILRSVPGQVVFDREGSWRLQGRFEDRASEVVTLQVPDDRSVTIVIPEAAP